MTDILIMHLQCGGMIAAFAAARGYYAWSTARQIRRINALQRAEMDAQRPAQPLSRPIYLYTTREG